MSEQPKIVLAGRDDTKAAFASAQRSLAQFKAQAAGVAAVITPAFAAIGLGAVGLTAAIAQLNIKPIIDTADQLGKLSQRTGISVESLSALDYAAKLADVSTEELATGLKRLNLNIAAAARGETEQAEAFKAIGVSVVDAAGKVRNGGVVFEEVTEKISQMADGANKVALVTAIGGKGFEAMIPLMNGGKRGIEAARQELEKLGGVYTGGLAKQSEEFNDNLTRLGVAVDALKIKLTAGVIDRLVELSQNFVKASQDGDLLSVSLGKLGEVFSGKIAREAAGSFIGAAFTQNIAQTQAEVDNLAGRIKSLQARLAENLGDAGLTSQLALVQQYAQDAQRDLAALESNRIGVAVNSGVFTRTDHDTTPMPKLKDAPKLRTAAEIAAAKAAMEQARTNAEALRAKELEGSIKRIEIALEEERDLFQNHNVRLAEGYADGELSIETFFAAKDRAQEASVLKTKAHLDEEIALLAAARDLPGIKPQDREEKQNQIDAIYAREAKAVREAAQATQTANREKTKSTEEFQRSLRDLDAQLAELSGNRMGAELARNMQRLDDAKKMLRLGDEKGDPAREAELARLLDMQARVAQAREQHAQITERAQIAEERFLIEAERSGLSRNAIEVGLARLREEALRQTDALIAKNIDLAAASTDPAVIAFFENVKLARERAFNAKDPALLRFGELAKSAGQTIADSFEDAIVNGGKFGDVLKSLEKDLIRLVARSLITQPLADGLSGLIRGGLGSLFGGTPTDFTLPQYGFENLGGVFHGGGIVGGNGGTLRRIDPTAWDGAPRYHEGGIVGERRAILMDGEEVLTERDPRHRNNYEGATPATPEVKVIVNAPPGTSVERQEERNGPNGRVFELWLKAAEDRVASGIASAAGPAARALKSRGVNLSGNLARSGR